MQALLRRFHETGRFDPVWETQVIVTVNKASKVSRRTINRLLQEQLNPSGRQVKPNPFRVGDKIICVKNSTLPLAQLGVGHPAQKVESYQMLNDQEFLANGELGKVLAVAEKSMIVRFTEPDRVVKITLGKPKAADDDDADGANTPGEEDGEEKRTAPAATSTSGMHSPATRRRDQSGQPLLC